MLREDIVNYSDMGKSFLCKSNPCSVLIPAMESYILTGYWMSEIVESILSAPIFRRSAILKQPEFALTLKGNNY